jgi:hypothetical protein
VHAFFATRLRGTPERCARPGLIGTSVMAVATVACGGTLVRGGDERAAGGPAPDGVAESAAGGVPVSVGAGGAETGVPPELRGGSRSIAAAVGASATQAPRARRLAENPAITCETYTAASKPTTALETAA